MPGKKLFLSLLPVLLVCVLCFTAAQAEAPVSGAGAESGEEAEWTVMFYLCGSDLESRHSYATGNLEEIAKCERPYAQSEAMAALLGFDPSQETVQIAERVNVVLETGGCRNWHASRLGMDISSRQLQRWSFEQINPDGSGGYRLEEELPLRSMADPDTLADFIAWGREKYPAKKYALVLWDHGGGSKNGLFIDELFGKDMMYLYELGNALRDGGVHFDMVLFDACLMANLETAYIIRDYASYMVASEEVVAGQGTAIGDWLQELYYAPSTDGKRLGRLICDMTQIKCAEIDQDEASELLTWSVIDLSKIEEAGQYFERFYELLGKAYKDYPILMQVYLYQMINSERFGSESDSMYDLPSLFYRTGLYQSMDPTIRLDMLEALEGAIIYNARGSDHFSARGLSFCYALALSPEELDIYAKNCPSPHFLALIDAVSPWTAPDWVYETAEKLPDINDIPAYDIRIEKMVGEDGVPGVNLAEGTENVALIQYKWYRKNEETGNTVLMGRVLAELGKTAEGKPVYQAMDPWNWYSVENEPCCIMMKTFYPGVQTLFEIPLKVGSNVWKIRVGTSDATEYQIYGVWDGSEYVGQHFNRNMKKLVQMEGRDYQLLYPVADTEDAFFEMGEEKPFLRSMTIGNTVLPAGTYYLEYIVMDRFLRYIPMERIEMHWDGERMTLPEGFTWDGVERLVWNGEPIT